MSLSPSSVRAAVQFLKLDLNSGKISFEEFGDQIDELFTEIL